MTKRGWTGELCGSSVYNTSHHNAIFVPTRTVGLNEVNLLEIEGFGTSLADVLNCVEPIHPKGDQSDGNKDWGPSEPCDTMDCNCTMSISNDFEPPPHNLLGRPCTVRKWKWLKV
eukprot:c15273_g1_i3.p2 GENE.c15273_g1_i3~~c15273_g1_i3.p2  ORF type:complete len:115 (-),score=14.02 c15273_g1_i3:389-733(-)